MTEVKIKIDDNLIDFMGFEEIEKKINDYLSQLYLKISASELLHDIEKVDLINDDDWIQSRELAWKQEGNSFSKYF